MEKPVLDRWESLFTDYFRQLQSDNEDASHDLSHFQRVANTAKYIAEYETSGKDLLVLIAAAYFHDIVSLPKNHPDNNMSSRLAASKAREILLSMDFPSDKMDAVCHAIEAHSFSAKLVPKTIEARIIQDADRMESLGAMGALRTFYVSGRLQRQPYHQTDLLASHRILDDKFYGLDHFYCKLFKLPELLQTAGGRYIANSRTDFLRLFVNELVSNVHKGDGGAFQIIWSCFHAGKLSLKLFDALDPFAVKRQLDPGCFVIDQLIEKKGQYPGFIEGFLSQLSVELAITERK